MSSPFSCSSAARAAFTRGRRSWARGGRGSERDGQGTTAAGPDVINMGFSASAPATARPVPRLPGKAHRGMRKKTPVETGPWVTILAPKAMAWPAAGMRRPRGKSGRPEAKVRTSTQPGSQADSRRGGARAETLWRGAGQARWMTEGCQSSSQSAKETLGCSAALPRAGIQKDSSQSDVSDEPEASGAPGGWPAAPSGSAPANAPAPACGRAPGASSADISIQREPDAEHTCTHSEDGCPPACHHRQTPDKSGASRPSTIVASTIE